MRTLIGAAEPPERPGTHPTAEQRLLGGMLLYTSMLAEVEHVRVTDFRSTQHMMVYQAVRDLWYADLPADPVSVGAALMARRRLGDVGGLPYLHELVTKAPACPDSFWACAVASQVEAA